MLVGGTATSGPVSWARVPDPTGATATRNQVSGAKRFNGGEGCHDVDGTCWFTTKGDNRVRQYDAAAQTTELAYDDSLVTGGSALLTGEWVQNTTAGTINANGIVGTPDGSALIVVNGGRLYRVPVDTGETVQLTLSGTDALTYGDGLLRIGHTLYAVQNSANQVSVLDLDDKAGTATLTRTITDARLDVPTTAASYGDLLYLANARLTTPPTADTTYHVIAVPR